jgi:probable HAF family extracellular repeat protein
VVRLATSEADTFSGLPITLTWSSSDATSCTAYGAWSGSKPLSGTESLHPPLPSNLFGLSCPGPSGTALAQVVVSVAIPRYRANSLSPMEVGAAINIQGDVVGHCGRPWSSAVGFIDNRYVPIAGTPPYEPPSCAPLPLTVFGATAINSQRTVLFAGGVWNALQKYGFVWQYGGGPAPSIPPGQYYFNDINDSGEIVGSQPMARPAVLIRQGERIELIGACHAASINNLGHVTGNAPDATGRCSHLLFYADGVAQDLGQFAGASTTRGTAINSADTIVGYAESSSGVRAFHYTAAQGYTDLGSLGGSHTWAFDISGAGQIVGSSTLPGQGAYDPTRAILFSEGRLVDLNDYVDDVWALFSPLSSATAINDAGWIVANACRPQPYNDCIAYRLTPILSR